MDVNYTASGIVVPETDRPCYPGGHGKGKAVVYVCMVRVKTAGVPGEEENKGS